MNARDGPYRILIVARPSSGQRVAARLSAANYVAFRTPSAGDLPGVLYRLQPHAVVIVPDSSWFEGLAVARYVRASHPTIPVFTIGDPLVDSTDSSLRTPSVGEGLDELVSTLDALLHPFNSSDRTLPDPV
jgi:hypothetical protein